MGKEIERKFLVKDDTFKSLAKGTRYRQGYLNSTKERVVRVRTIDDKGFLTVKGITTGATRVEYEYEIPAKDADAMLDSLYQPGGRGAGRSTSRLVTSQSQKKPPASLVMKGWNLWALKLNRTGFFIAAILPDILLRMPVVLTEVLSLFKAA